MADYEDMPAPVAGFMRSTVLAATRSWRAEMVRESHAHEYVESTRAQITTV